MLVYVLRQIRLLSVTLILVSLLCFSLTYLFPNEPLSTLAGVEPSQLSNELSIQLSEKYMLDKSLFYQYIQFVHLSLLGDWGNSLNSGQALKAEILQVIPASLELVSYALILSFTLGISLGFLAALVRDTPWDRFAVSLSLAGYSIPIFWFCILAISVFSMQLNWLPLSGRIGLLNSVPSATGFIFIDIFLAEIPNKFVVYQDAFLHLILPTFCLTVATFTVILRIVRRSTLEVLKIDYIKAATCKGLTRKQVFWRHTARNALIPALPNLASQIGILLTNALIVESIFSWPGIGNWLLQAIYQQDYSAIQIGLFVVSSLAAIVIILMETLSHLLDPKNRTTVSVKA